MKSVHLSNFTPGADRRRHGFSTIEVLFAITALALFIAGAVATTTQLNRFAATSRMQTLATALAQQKIDEVLAVPWTVSGTVPAILCTTGTPGTLTTTDSNIPLNNDTYATQGTFGSTLSDLDLQINATRTTTVTLAGTSTSDTRTRKVEVAVSYIYRGRSNTINMNTLRVSDDF